LAPNLNAIYDVTMSITTVKQKPLMPNFITLDNCPCPYELRGRTNIHFEPSSFVAVEEIYVNERGLEPTKAEVNIQ